MKLETVYELALCSMKTRSWNTVVSKISLSVALLCLVAAGTAIVLAGGGDTEPVTSIPARKTDQISSTGTTNYTGIVGSIGSVGIQGFPVYLEQ